jgi:hypothetical protein
MAACIAQEPIANELWIIPITAGDDSRLAGPFKELESAQAACAVFGVDYGD